MLTRLIGGNRVITLGTAIEQNFLTNDNYGMGSTIGVILILTMFITMWVTKGKERTMKKICQPLPGTGLSCPLPADFLPDWLCL